MAENEDKGYIEGSYYYSKALPKGSGETTKYNREDADLLATGLGLDVSNEQILQVQRKLISLGYLDPGDDDGYKGDATIGAIKRYQSNTANAAMWNTIIDMKDNFMDFFE